METTLLTEFNVQIAPTARIKDFVLIGCGSQVGDGTVIGEFSEIGDYAQIGHNVRIERSAVIGKFAVIRDGAVISEGAVIGSGAQIGERAHIPPWAVVPENAVVADYEIVRTANVWLFNITVAQTWATIGTRPVYGPVTFEDLEISENLLPAEPTLRAQRKATLVAQVNALIGLLRAIGRP